MAALTAWRLAYYGWPLPNTYYAKVSGALAERVPAALAQLGDLALTAGLAVPLLILALSGGGVAPRARDPVRALLRRRLAGYWIYVGGDVFGERFLLVLLPLAIASLAREAAAGRRAAAAAGPGRAGAVPGRAARRRPAVRLRRRREVRPLGGRRPPAGVARASRQDRSRWTPRARSPSTRGSPPSTCSASPTRTSPTSPRRRSASATASTTRTTSSPGGPISSRRGWRRGSTCAGAWTAARYEAAGYRLRYLAWTRRTPPGPAILDLRAVDPAEVPELVRRGYRYAVAERPGDQRTAAARDGFAAR